MPDNTHGRNKARNERIMALRAQGKSFLQIAVSEGLSRSLVSGVVSRDHGRNFHERNKDTDRA